MVEFRVRHSGQERPSSSLGVEMTEEQVTILAPTMQDLTVRSILKDAGGEGATKKLAQRKLNNAGAITNHCGLQNHPARIKKLLSALELTASLAEISALAKSTKDEGKCKADTELLDLSPATLVKFHGEKIMGDVSKLTKKEICALSFRYFGTMYKEANPKPVLVSGLEGLMAAQPAVLPAAVAAAAAAAAAAPAVVAAAAVAPAPAAAAAAEVDSDEEHELEDGDA
jgi:ribosomal protein L12E/L44/L45/RPP1/RPP2